MTIDRRRLIAGAGSAAVAAAVGPFTAAQAAGEPIKAVAFDAFPIFDPRPAFEAVANAAPQMGDALRQAFFDKLFAYSWLRTAGGRYKGFTAIMDDALRFAAASLHLQLTAAARGRVIDAFFELPVWPDVKVSLERLRDRGLGLAFLSNMSETMLRANMSANGIEGFFDEVLSTDRAQVFKPHPEAYRLGPDVLGLKRDEIAFAAFAGWDAAGAAWFGYPTVWVNRFAAPVEELDAGPFTTGGDLDALLGLANA